MAEDITWKEFVAANPTFQKVFEKAFKASPALALETELNPDDDAGSVITSLMIAVTSDFDSIMTLCALDKVWGALKLLRCAYERAVTLKYIALNPTEAQKFLDFDAIDWEATISAIEAKGIAYMNPEGRENLRGRAAEAKTRYRQEKCPTCGMRKQTTWTSHSAQALAQKAQVDHMFLEAFAIPSKHIHPTYFGIRSEMQGSGSLMYNVVKGTHALAVESVLAHQLYFRGNRVASELANEVLQGFFSVWKYADTDFGVPDRITFIQLP